ncbi:hypothetical protein EGW08_014323, partial [Elysia chlorotica]
PSSLTQVIRRFGRQLEDWLRSALHGLPEVLTHMKLDLARRFCQVVKRQISLNHLVQASRTVVSSQEMVAQLLTDWLSIDLSSILKQTLYTLEGSTVRDNKAIVHSEFSYYDKVILISRQFLLMWSCFGTRLVRDMTLHNAPSFGSFHLLHLMFDDYVLYRVEALHSEGRVQDLLRTLRGETTHDCDLQSDDLSTSEDDQESQDSPSPPGTDSGQPHHGLTSNCSLITGYHHQSGNTGGQVLDACISGFSGHACADVIRSPSSRLTISTISTSLNINIIIISSSNNNTHIIITSNKNHCSTNHINYSFSTPFNITRPTRAILGVPTTTNSRRCNITIFIIIRDYSCSKHRTASVCPAPLHHFQSGQSMSSQLRPQTFSQALNWTSDPNTQTNTQFGTLCPGQTWTSPLPGPLAPAPGVQPQLPTLTNTCLKQRLVYPGSELPPTSTPMVSNPTPSVCAPYRLSDSAILRDAGSVENNMAASGTETGSGSMPVATPTWRRKVFTGLLDSGGINS